MDTKQKLDSQQKFEQRDRLATKMYGGSDSVNYGQAITSYYSRRDSQLIGRNDREGLALSRTESKQLEAFARKHGMSNDDLRVALNRLHEHETFERSQTTIETRRAATWKRGVEAAGGETAYRENLTRAGRFQEALAKELPTLAARARQTGAAEDFELLNICSKYGIEPASTQEK